MHQFIITALMTTGTINIMLGFLYIFFRNALFKRKSSDDVDIIIFNHNVLRKRDFFSIGSASLVVGLYLNYLIENTDPLLFFIYYFTALLLMFISFLINCQATLILALKKHDKLILIVPRRRIITLIFLAFAPILYGIMIGVYSGPMSYSKQYERLFQLSLVIIAFIVIPMYQLMKVAINDFILIRDSYYNLIKMKSKMSTEIYLIQKKNIFKKYIDSTTNKDSNKNNSKKVVDFLLDLLKDSLVNGMSGQIENVGTKECTLSERVGSVYGIVIDIPDYSKVESVFNEFNVNDTLKIEEWLPIKDTLYPFYWGMDINLGSRLVIHAKNRSPKTGAIGLNDEKFESLNQFNLYYGSILVTNYSECEAMLHREHKSLLSKIDNKKPKNPIKPANLEDTNNDSKK